MEYNMTSEDSLYTQNFIPYFSELVPFGASARNSFEEFFHRHEKVLEEDVKYTATWTNAVPVQPRGTTESSFRNLRYDISTPLVSYSKSNFAAIIAHYRAILW